MLSSLGLLFRQSDPFSKNLDARFASKKREFRAVQSKAHPDWANTGQTLQPFDGAVPVFQTSESQSELEVAAALRVERRGLRHQPFCFRSLSRARVGHRQISPIIPRRCRKNLDRFGGSTLT